MAFLPVKTEILRVSSGAPEAEPIARGAAIVRGGGLVAFPTETVYGLGANALDAEAAARIFAAKGRPGNNPMIVHVAGAEQIHTVAADWPAPAARLAERFWPGPLSLVVRKRAELPAVVTAGGNTVAVRMPDHPIALALIRAAGVPLAAPSANRSSRLSPTCAEHVLHDLDGRIDMVLDGGPTAGGLESTVLDLTTSPPRLLRPGLIPPSAIEAEIGPIILVLRGVPAGELPMPSPGMLERHYAPRAPLQCVGDEAESYVEKLRRAGLHIGWLTRNATSERPGVTVRVMPSDPAGYAAELYAALHSLDDEGVDRILVSMPPDTEEWLAVRDRLRRASAKNK